MFLKMKWMQPTLILGQVGSSTLRSLLTIIKSLKWYWNKNLLDCSGKMILSSFPTQLAEDYKNKLLSNDITYKNVYSKWAGKKTHKSINLCDNVCIMQCKTSRPQLFMIILRTLHMFVSICKTKDKEISDNHLIIEHNE